MTAQEFQEEFGESTLRLFLLGFLTFGIYYFIWFADKRRGMNKLANREIYDANLLIYAAICSGLPFVLNSLHIVITAPFILISELVYSIIMLMIAWKVGKWFDEFSKRWWGIDLKVNSILLVIVNIFYLNYLINKAAQMEKSKNLY
jgi:hypothetical protein